MLATYQREMDRVKSDGKHKLALARTFVLPGRCGLQVKAYCVCILLTTAHVGARCTI